METIKELETNEEYLSCSNKSNYLSDINKIICIINEKLSLYNSLDYKEYKEYTNEFIYMICKYQEQPYVLDNYLEKLCKPIANYIAELLKSISLDLHEIVLSLNNKELELENYDLLKINTKEHKNIYRLSDCIYHLCKIRGLKIISLYFPSEVNFLEIVIDYITLQDQFKLDSDLIQDDDINWHFIYALYVWLTNLVLIPFSFEVLDSKYTLKDHSLFQRILRNVISKVLENKYCVINETASFVFAKICCRADFNELWISENNAIKNVLYKELENNSISLGILIWLKNLIKLAPIENIQIFVDKIICYLDIPNENDKIETKNYSSFKLISFRLICISKLIIRSIRNWDLSHYFPNFDKILNWSLNLMIEYNKNDHNLLRHTSSKCIAKILSSITNEEYVNRIVREILLLNESNSYTKSGELNLIIYKDISPNELEGKCLTIAELIRTRINLIFDNYLKEIISFIKYCLNYEFWIGSRSFGVQIRDSACYIIWSLARVVSPKILKPYVNEIIESTLPLTVFDTQINGRRVSCAALQEFIGRQGGENVPFGISIVTIADFFTISSLKSSFIEISTKIGSLSLNKRDELGISVNYFDKDHSHNDSEFPFSIILIKYLVQNLFVHPNIKYRLLSLIALSKLIPYSYSYCFSTIIYTITSNFKEELENSSNDHLNIFSSNYIYRHSSLMILSVLLLKGQYLKSQNIEFWDRLVYKNDEASRNFENENCLFNKTNSSSIPKEFTWSDYIRNIPIIVEKNRLYRGKGGDLTRKGVLCLIISLCKSIEFIKFKKSTFKRFLQTISESIRHLSFTIQISGCSAINALILWRMENSYNSPELEEIQKLIIEYINCINNDYMNVHIMALRGFILSLGVIFPKIAHLLSNQLIKDIFNSLVNVFNRDVFVISENENQDYIFESDKYIAFSKYDIECRRNSIISLGMICLTINNSSLNFKKDILKTFHEILILGCFDYSTDKRGDVGSWIRELSMEILTCLYTNGVFDDFDYYDEIIKAFVFNIFNYSDKIRLKAILLLWRILDRYFNGGIRHYSYNINIYWVYYRIFYGVPYELFELIRIKNQSDFKELNNFKESNLSLRYKLYRSCYSVIQTVIEDYKMIHTKNQVDELTSFFDSKDNPFNNSCCFFDLLNSLELIPHYLLPYIDFENQFLFCISNRNFQIFSASNIQVFKDSFFNFMIEKSIQKQILLGLINWVNHISISSSTLNPYQSINCELNLFIKSNENFPYCVNSIFKNLEKFLELFTKYMDNNLNSATTNILKFILLLFTWDIFPLETTTTINILQIVLRIFSKTKDFHLIKTISAIIVHLSFNFNFEEKLNQAALNSLSLLVSHEYPNIRSYTADYIYKNICYIQKSDEIEEILEFIRDTEWNHDLNNYDLYQIKMQFINLTKSKKFYKLNF